jgi:hypothetical protein
VKVYYFTCILLAWTSLPALAGPASVPATPPPENEPDSEITLGPTFAQSRLDAFDKLNSANAAFLSDLNTGFAFQWARPWTDKLDTLLLFRFNRYTFQTASAKTFEHSSSILGDFGVGTRIRASEKIVLSTRVGYGQQLFVRGVNPTTIALEPVAIPEWALSASWQALRSRRFSAGIEGTFTAYVPSSTDAYSIGFGTGYQAKTYCTQDIGVSAQLQAGLFYRKRNQGTSQIDQSQADAGFELSLQWTFGRTPPPDPRMIRRLSEDYRK